MAKLQTCDKHVETFINLLSDAGSIPRHLHHDDKHTSDCVFIVII